MLGEVYGVLDRGWIRELVGGKTIVRLCMFGVIGGLLRLKKGGCYHRALFRSKYEGTGNF